MNKNFEHSSIINKKTAPYRMKYGGGDIQIFSRIHIYGSSCVSSTSKKRVEK
jgi:hypothetical protein